MSFDIDKLAEKTKNLSIGPVYDTNWCDMPAEIKLKCIGKMELSERLSVRCTAKAERSLVESQKVKFQYGNIRVTSMFLDASLIPKYQDKIAFRKFGNVNKGFECLKFIWKVVVFENLAIKIRDRADAKEEIMSYTGKISAKNIEFDFCDNDVVVPILQKMDNSVESITVNAEADLAVDEILEITQVQNVPFWQILYYKKRDSLHKVAQMWLDKNSKVGTIFKASVKINGSFEEFSKHFLDCIVSKSEKRVRISTNNPDRHILLERGLDDVYKMHHPLKFFRLMVIPAEMKDSEYDDNCKEWICKMVPLTYKYFVRMIM
ncbi:hypothetical protein B9Z55_012757 [Caenorhabditis nigoni]|uniref:F-box domain-containing protein n=1 Tax=Caenorhabditis nigoni TaxID=1611254 RepID=A0A2G5TZP7_9PELO|nr:hypothetical protein B9Z55_012757 [Caenorhabditis nigoni]